MAVKSSDECTRNKLLLILKNNTEETNNSTETNPYLNTTRNPHTPATKTLAGLGKDLLITDKTETPEVVPAPLASPACPLQTAAKRDNYYIVISDTPAREEIEQTPNFASEEEEIDSVPTEGYTSEDEWSTDADSVCNGRMSVLPWGEDGGPQGPGNREGQGIFSVGKDGPRGVQDTKERAAREGRRKSEPSVRVGAVTGRL
ncbi:hypothetical protein ACJJTC_011528 [Scirpophaga incertulas]